jgi:diacylglycerol O-acyltransferase
MNPANYIEKVSLVTGEVLPDEIKPRQLLVHSHRDYHIVDVQARWLMSRLVDVVGDQDEVVKLTKKARELGLGAVDMLSKLIGSPASKRLAQKLLGLKEREYYFRYKGHGLTGEEIEKRLSALREEAAKKTAQAKGDGGAVANRAAFRVLLTGGSGFVGKEVIYQAAQDDDVAELVVLIRPKTVRDRKTNEVVKVISPAERGAALVEQLWLEGAAAEKIRFIAGDIEEPNLGVEEAEMETLKKTITHVVHSAASVSFDDPYEESFRANVDGAVNALEFSYALQSAEGSPFIAHLGIETSYIHGRQTHQPAREDEVIFPRNFYNNYYELTKAMGSIETERYMLEKGLRVVQLCPSIVIGDSRTGNNRGDTKVVNAPVNVFGRVHKAMRQGSLAERSKARLLGQMASMFPGDPTAELNLITIDWVSAGIIAALKHPEAVGARVHLATDKRMTSEDIRDTVHDELGFEIRLSEPTLHRNVKLPAMTAVLEAAGQDKIAHGLQKLGQIFGSYSEWGQPVHEVGNDETLLGMPAERPNTLHAFRMLCRHNRWVQHFGKIWDLDEISRRERLWTKVIAEIEEETGRAAGSLTAKEFRTELNKRMDPDAFAMRVPGDDSWQSVVAVPQPREPVGAVDTAWLQMDHPENRMVINVMLFFDEVLSLEELRTTVGQRLLRVARFTQRVAPRDREGPVWETDPDFNLDNHLLQTPLPRASSSKADDEAGLKELLDELVSRGLDLRRPPWRIHLVSGLSYGSAMIVRLHHCIGDGAALAYLMLSLTDVVGDAAEDPAEQAIGEETETPERNRHHGALFRLSRLVKRSGVMLHDGLTTALKLPGQSVDLAKAGVSGAAALGKLVLKSDDPPSVLRGELQVEKKVAWSKPISLAQVKAIRRALDATVNDVLMGALAGALKRYLESRGDTPREIGTLRAVVPVNLRPKHKEPRLGNHFGLVFLDLPVGMDHELDRIDEVRRSMDALRSSPEALLSLGALAGMGRLADAVEKQALQMFSAKASLVVSNVPGPFQRLAIAGKSISSIMFWVPQSGSIGVGVSILSYAGEIRLGVFADAGLVPDPEALVEALEAEIEALSAGLSLE